MISSTHAGTPELVFLPGWGFSTEVFATVLREEAGPRLRARKFRRSEQAGPGFDAQHCRDALVPTLPPVCDLLGWSLGGQVAMEIAAADPGRVRRLVLVATTPCFVRRRGWSAGMPRATFDDFTWRLAVDPSATLRHFAGLVARGDANERSVLRKLRAALSSGGEPDALALRAGLDLLSENDQRTRVREIRVPTLVIHGARDRLVPLAAGRWLTARIPGARLVTLPGAAHAPFLSDAAAFSAAVSEFLASA